MLTVKYVDGDGIEWLSECAYVVADRTIDGAPRVLVFDEMPDAFRANSSGVYCDDQRASAGGPLHGPTVYVMNRFGATVATYRLSVQRGANTEVAGLAA